MRIRYALLLLITLLLPLVACDQESNTAGSGPHISVHLITDQSSVKPGVPFHVGVHFVPEPGWHVYWRNPGDSGLAPKFSWETSSATKISPALWPYPQRITEGPLTNYGYNEVVISFPALVDSSELSENIRLGLDTQWLVCKDECLPGSAKLNLTLPVVEANAAPEASIFAPLFSRYLAMVPAPLDHVAVVIEEREAHITLSILPLENQTLPTTASFFPDDGGIINNSAAQVVSGDGKTLRITLERATSRTAPIDRIRGVLLADQGWSPSGTPRAVTIDTDPPASPSNTIDPSPMQLPVAELPLGSPAPISLATALLFAVLGGVLLNLMPCVFPVLSIKVLSFMQQACDDQKKIRLHGASFCAGVIVSFWALAAVLITVRVGGEKLGWGFQLQSPIFVFAMIFIFFVLGLLFISDLAIGNSIQRLAGASRLPTSYIGSFLNGVLATAVATPCTGPFMSSALAATLTLSSFSSFLVFTALGVGMGLPYLILSFQPRLLRLLPRPGAWMETFKQAMAFPLFASVVWLARVFARQVGFDGIALTLFTNVLWGLLFAALSFWLLGRAGYTKRRIPTYALQLAAVGTFCMALIIAYPTEDKLRRAQQAGSTAATRAEGEPDIHGLVWERYSEERVNELQRAGTPIYVDFTAEWCITCQVNEGVVFASAEVRELLRKKKVVLLRGDWTSMDPSITAALKKHDRNGVPLNLLYKGRKSTGESGAPIIFPNILTPGTVLKELTSIID